MNPSQATVSVTAPPSRTARLRAFAARFNAERQHHGLQLAAAVLAAYGLATLLRLPEQLWAVMTTLIVMRPNSGGTWDAGWDRARGTVAGALVGLAGVFLDRHGADALAVLLVLVAGLSFASAAAPGLRSAPVAALIILGAGQLPGHSALQVAALRVGQILLGIGVAMAIALASSRYRAPDRFRLGAAALLRRLAARIGEVPVAGAIPEQAEPAERTAAARRALERLGTLADSADREAGLFRHRHRRPSHQPGQHQRIATLLARLVQDISVLNRVLRVLAEPGNDPLAAEAARTAAAALASIADQLAEAPSVPPAKSRAKSSATPKATEEAALKASLEAPSATPTPLEALARTAAATGRGRDGMPAGRSGLLLGAPLHLLLADVKRLNALLAPPAEGGGRSGAESRPFGLDGARDSASISRHETILASSPKPGACSALP